MNEIEQAREQVHKYREAVVRLEAALRAARRNLRHAERGLAALQTRCQECLRAHQEGPYAAPPASEGPVPALASHDAVEGCQRVVALPRTVVSIRTEGA